MTAETGLPSASTNQVLSGPPKARPEAVQTTNTFGNAMIRNKHFSQSSSSPSATAEKNRSTEDGNADGVVSEASHAAPSWRMLGSDFDWPFRLDLSYNVKKKLVTDIHASVGSATW